MTLGLMEAMLRARSALWVKYLALNKLVVQITMRDELCRGLMATVDPAPLLSVRVDEASRMIGIGMTKLYELIKAGDLETVKIGRATLVTMGSLRRLIER